MTGAGATPTPPLCTAIVGLGNMGLTHARAIAALPEYDLVAGCDIVPALVDRFTGEVAGATGHGDYSAMLATERPDVVVITTNNVTHAPLTVQAAEAGAGGDRRLVAYYTDEGFTPAQEIEVRPGTSVQVFE